MLVLDNLIYRWQHSGGISTVWYELTKRIIQERCDYMFLEYANSNTFNHLRALEEIPEDRLRILSDKHFTIKRYLPINYEYNSPFVFHSSYYRNCSNSNAVNIITIHDFTYELFRKGLAKRIHTFTKSKAIANANYIVCISQNTKRDLLRFHPNTDRNKIKVIYNGVSDSFHPNNTNNEDYLLFVGDRGGYKNFNLAVQAAAQEKMKLIICGKPISKKERDKLEQIIPGGYIEKGFVSEQELNTLYNKAFALIYPSSYEGFGLPVIEAQKAGCPVIVMDSSSLPEVIGCKEMLCNPSIPNEIALRINYLKDKVNRNHVIQSGLEKASKFSWDKTFAAYNQLYNNIEKGF